MGDELRFRSVTRVVALGEAMIRFTPAPPMRRIEQADSFEALVGGAELNALIAVRRFGLATTWVTRLPDNGLGRLIVAHARRYGVEPHVRWDPDARVGLYFIDRGVPPRPTQVLYDRSGSGMSRLNPADFDWSALLDTESCLHVTGITPALSDGARLAVVEALDVARSVGAYTSFDVNYRSRLWGVDEARPVLSQLSRGVDFLFASPQDLEAFFDAGTEPIVAAQRVRDRDGIGTVVITFREELDGGRIALWVTVVGEETVTSKRGEAVSVDPLGAGDALAGAFLVSAFREGSVATAADLAVRAATFKHTIAGDVLAVDPMELDPDFGGGRSLLR
jgi:2-dehydro-3-deoxygluconokinase